MTIMEDYNTNNITELQTILLRNRGIESGEDARSFLYPDFEKGVYDPFLLQDMEVAVGRILRAIELGEKIVVYGDYDCDGIPGSVVMHDFFKKIGYANFLNYIPHRHNEGYGLHNAAIDGFARDGTTLLITVDLGITNVKEVAYAQSLGIDCIITDHHLPHSEIVDGALTQILPPALAVINAKRTGNTYPDDMLCGCATAWKLVCALLERGHARGIKEFVAVPIGWEKWLLDMVGISTITDMVPLQNENRVLAHYGLKVLKMSKRPGLIALLRKAGVSQSDLTEEDIGFTIGPRVNAASRMDIPMEAFTLFASTGADIAERQAAHLEGLNVARKESVLHFMKKAYKLAELKSDQPVIVVGDLDWSPGVLGLIATKLLEVHKKSVFVWGRGEDGDSIKGSCRSDGLVHLVDLMQATPVGTFTAMGGHEQAGGFAVEYTSIHDLEKNIIIGYEKIKHQPLIKAEPQAVDTDLTFDAVNLATVGEVRALAPYGVANPRPLFKWSGAVDSAKVFGKQKNHLEICFKDSRGKIVKAIGFFRTTNLLKKNGEQVELSAGMEIEMTGNIELSVFAGSREVRVRIADIIV